MRTREERFNSCLEEIKVAISEAVSNAIIHGYGDTIGEIEFTMTLDSDSLEFIVTDYGRGIADIALARQPSYSTDPERMGLGFVFMESFMDQLIVESEVGRGTTVRMAKQIQADQEH
ncbi:MAG: anti-sigma F factor [Negativicutes bacterium]|nr:anti-sigma F factor [Negativicutes bacterium]